MTGLLIRAGGLLLMLSPLALIFLPLPDPPAPQRPQDASADTDWLVLPFQAVAGLAGLCWCAVGLLVFLSPLLVLAWLVLR